MSSADCTRTNLSYAIFVSAGQVRLCAGKHQLHRERPSRCLWRAESDTSRMHPIESGHTTGGKEQRIQSKLTLSRAGSTVCCWRELELPPWKLIRDPCKESEGYPSAVSEPTMPLAAAPRAAPPPWAPAACRTPGFSIPGLPPPQQRYCGEPA